MYNSTCIIFLQKCLNHVATQYVTKTHKLEKNKPWINVEV